MALKFKQLFTVRGSGQFPFDMLRYDHCFPFEESESRNLAGDYDEETRTVVISRFIETKGEMPTVDRWRSFCWEVLEDSIVTERLP